MGKEKGAIPALGVLGILAAVFLVNQACTKLFPIIGVITIVAFIISIVISFVDSDSALLLWITTGVLVVVTFILFLCGPGFASTDLGSSLVDSGNASYEALKEVHEAKKTVKNAKQTVQKEIIAGVAKTLMNSTENSTHLSGKT